MSAITPFGDRALRFTVPSGAERRQLLVSLRELPGIADVVLAEELGAIVLDANASPSDALPGLERALATATTTSTSTSTPTRHTIHVVYDGEDLAALSAETKLSVDDLVALHTGAEYEVAMLGFLPGFAYLRGIDPRLVVARRAAPRSRVPPGSVAIAAGYTGIYPYASPGGWHLLGEAIDYRAFGEGGATFAVGDRVRFERAAQRPAKREAPSARAPEGTRGPHLEVRRVQGPSIVVDRGRFGHMHEGVPRGGPLVREALAFANLAIGNDEGAAGIELYGVIELVARGGKVLVADDVRGAIALEDGEAIVVGTEGRARVRYVAVEGGVDVPVVLGGRGTLLVAGIGGIEGRVIRRGERISGSRSGTGTGTGTGERLSTRVDTTVPIVAGPDGDDGVMAAVTGGTFTVGHASDRTGTRLEGPAISMQTARDWKSGPMVVGAIELTPAGLVVLGPDHPTTGGYPVIGVVESDAIGKLFAQRIGGVIRFRKSTAAGT